jgi:hypothetical protein
MAQRKQWKDLTGPQRLSVFVMIGIQVSLLAGALADIRRRPPELIRGPKAMWGVVAFINYVGPISYFVFGRKAAPQLVPPA